MFYGMEFEGAKIGLRFVQGGEGNYSFRFKRCVIFSSWVHLDSTEKEVRSAA